MKNIFRVGCAVSISLSLVGCGPTLPDPILELNQDAKKSSTESSNTMINQAVDWADRLVAAYNSGGQVPSPEFTYEDTDNFDEKLFSSLHKNSHQDKVHVTVKAGDGEAFPERLKKWMIAAQLTSGPIRVCDVRKTQFDWAAFVLKSLKVVTTVAPVRDYRVIVEFDSSKSEFAGVLFYKKTLKSEDIENEYGKCRDYPIEYIVASNAKE